MLTWLNRRLWQLEAKMAVCNCGLQLVPGRLETTSVIFRKSSEEGAVCRAGSFLKTNGILHCVWKLKKIYRIYSWHDHFLTLATNFGKLAPEGRANHSRREMETSLVWRVFRLKWCALSIWEINFYNLFAYRVGECVQVFWQILTSETRFDEAHADPILCPFVNLHMFNIIEKLIETSSWIVRFVS